MSEHNNINTINNNNYSSISYKNYVFDLDKHEVFYIDNLPVNIELYTCLLSSSGSNNILNKLQKKLFKDLTSDEKQEIYQVLGDVMFDFKELTVEPHNGPMYEITDITGQSNDDLADLLMDSPVQSALQ